MSQGHAIDIQQTDEGLSLFSKHSKFEVEFPADGSKPPPKHPSSIRKSNIPAPIEDADFITGESNTFI